MTEYTAEDFKRAEFARHPEEGGVGMRKDAGDPNTWCVAYEDPGWRIGIRSDIEMARDGWVPVPAGSYTRTDQPRPLTPDAITDEMVKRARVAWLGANINLTPDGFVREILTAALTEPPARPEGAERWEDFLIDSLDYQALTDQQITDLADRIAEEMNR